MGKTLLYYSRKLEKVGSGYIF